MKEKTDLKDGVHDAGERSIMGMFCHLENVQTPFVDVLQVLLVKTTFQTSWTQDGITEDEVSTEPDDPSAAYLGKQLLLVRFDPEAIPASGDAGGMADLSHPADLCHHSNLRRLMMLLLLLRALPPLPLPGLLDWTWKFQLILLVCTKQQQKKETPLKECPPVAAGLRLLAAKLSKQISHLCDNSHLTRTFTYFPSPPLKIHSLQRR